MSSIIYVPPSHMRETDILSFKLLVLPEPVLALEDIESMNQKKDLSLSLSSLSLSFSFPLFSSPPISKKTNLPFKDLYKLC